MQQRVGLVMLCFGLLASCGGAGSPTGDGGAPVTGGGSGAGDGSVDDTGDTVDDGTEGDGTDDDGGTVTVDDGTGTDGTDGSGGDSGTGGEGTGGDGTGDEGTGGSEGDGNGGDGPVVGGGGDTEPPAEPETVEVKFDRISTNFGRIDDLFAAGEYFPSVNFQVTTPSPTAGSVDYVGSFNLEAYTISPYLYGRMYGDATVTIQLDTLAASGDATGFAGNFFSPSGQQLVAYDGRLLLLGSPGTTGAGEDVSIRATGDLTHDIYTFAVDALLGGNFSGDGGVYFRADANTEVTGAPVAVGDIGVIIHGNAASSATATLVLERAPASP